VPVISEVSLITTFRSPIPKHDHWLQAPVFNRARRQVLIILQIQRQKLASNRCTSRQLKRQKFRTFGGEEMRYLKR
jgi:hypothetical protein